MFIPGASDPIPERGGPTRERSPPITGPRYARAMLRRSPTLAIAAAAAAFFVASPGCGDDDGTLGDGGPDAALDGAPGDASVADGGADAGPPAPAYCSTCRRDSDCDDGALCLVLAGGERGCGRACETQADCAALPYETTCEEEVAGQPLQCKPAGGTCVTVDAGTDCASDAECGGRFDRCVDADGLGGRCTSACDVDADCVIGMHRCAATTPGGRVCVPDERPASERCDALVAAGGATACADDGACGAMPCLHAPGEMGVCAVAAPEGSCASGPPIVLAGGGTACAPSAGTFGPDALREATADCLCYARIDPGSLFDDALALAGRDRCDLYYRSSLIDLFEPAIVHDPYRLSLTDRLWGDWGTSVPVAERVAADLDVLEGSLAGGIARAAAWGDLEVDPATPEPLSLADALVALLEATGATPDRTTIDGQVAGITPAVAAAVAPIVVAVRDAYLAREQALARLGDEDRSTYFDGPSGLLLSDFRALDLQRSTHRGALLGDVDVGKLASAAVELAAAIEAADLASLGAPAGDLTVVTPIGRVAIRGGATDTTYEDAEWHATALLVNLGGNDTYLFPAGATTDAGHGIAVVVDAGGDDAYGYDEHPVAADASPAGGDRVVSDADGRGRTGVSLSRTPRQGAGVLGVGILVDLGVGIDHYTSQRRSQGFGSLGVGVLYDGGGDDEYRAEIMSQGGGLFGIGLLVDAGGSDRYVAYSMAQGFGHTRGVGALWDGGGDDAYVLVPNDPLYPSAQDGGTNASLGQGEGFGRRADGIPDGQFMSGGLGVLRDVSGADTYRAGIFAQASGYWFGTGLLVDSAGNDTYDGQWYVQSGSAHFATSAFIDEHGDDIYNSTALRQNVAIGGGHDFSAAFFVDREGHDIYYAPGLGFGAGNAGGFGAFGDASGDDAYDSTSDLSFGNASVETPGDPARRMSGTVGLFMDADGVDTYARPTIAPVASDSEWTQSAHTGESESGAGIDRSAGRLGI